MNGCTSVPSNHVPSFTFPWRRRDPNDENARYMLGRRGRVQAPDVDAGAVVWQANVAINMFLEGLEIENLKSEALFSNEGAASLNLIVRESTIAIHPTDSQEEQFLVHFSFQLPEL